jgi:hypothetical protein
VETSLYTEVGQRAVVPHFIFNCVNVQIFIRSIDSVQEIAENSRHVVGRLTELTFYLEHWLCDFLNFWTLAGIKDICGCRVSSKH